MKARLNTSFAIAGTALILLSGCVSNRKYKASQAALEKARTDSAQLAQQVQSLNGNVSDLQSKNSTLHSSLDNTTRNFEAQKHSLDYYQTYFKQQQDTLAQVSEDVKSALTQAGISNGDVQQVNNAIYVRLDENELFTKNSTMMSPTGKKALNGLTQAISGRTGVDVAVSSGDSATGWVAMSTPSDEADMDRAPRRHRVVHHSRNTATASSGASASGGTAANTSGAGTKSTGAPAHRKMHHKYGSEGSMAIYNGRSHNRAWALKQGRMVTVANHFLKNGAPKINLSLQRPPANGAPQNTAIKVIITPKMDGFTPPQAINSSASR